MGTVFITNNHILFASGAATQVEREIPLRLVRAIKAETLATGRSIVVDAADGKRYVFASFRDRDAVYALLDCLHQASSADAQSTSAAVSAVPRRRVVVCTATSLVAIEIIKALVIQGDEVTACVHNVEQHLERAMLLARLGVEIVELDLSQASLQAVPTRRPGMGANGGDARALASPGSHTAPGAAASPATLTAAASASAAAAAAAASAAAAGGDGDATAPAKNALLHANVVVSIADYEDVDTFLDIGIQTDTLLKLTSPDVLQQIVRCVFYYQREIQTCMNHYRH